MAKPLIGLYNMKLSELSKYADRILTNMRENEHTFPNPIPDLQTFQSMIESYHDAMTDAAFRDKRAIIIRDQLGEKLKNAIRSLASYVNMIAAGDELKIIDSGFAPSKRAEPISAAPKASLPRVKSLGIGSCGVKVRVDRWTQAIAYRFEYRKAGDDETWQFVISSKASWVFRELEQFQEYEFRVAYLARDPQFHYSSVVSSIVV